MAIVESILTWAAWTMLVIAATSVYGDVYAHNKETCTAKTNRAAGWTMVGAYALAIWWVTRG